METLGIKNIFIKFLGVIIIIFLSACRKEVIVITPALDEKYIDSIDLDIYLLDYDSIDLGNINSVGNHVFDYQNTQSFNIPYGITKCNGVVLDSFGLSYADSVYSLNMNPADSTPDFNFNLVLTFCMPNIIEGVKINRSQRTLLEIWNKDAVGNKVKLGTFLIGPYGTYGEPIDDAIYSRNYLSGDHSCKTLTIL